MFLGMNEKDAESFNHNLIGHGFNAVLKAFNELKATIIGKALSFLEGPVEYFNRRELLSLSAIQGVEWLTRTLGPDMEAWKWGRIHKLKLEHPMAARLSMPELNSEMPYDGDSTTPNQATYNLSINNGQPDFNVMKGTGAVAACRVVMAPSHWDESRSVLTGGQSAKWLSKHYSDQVDLFQSYKAKPMLWSRKKVEEGCVYKRVYTK